MFQESVIGVPVSVDMSVYSDASARQKFISILFVGDAFVFFYLTATGWRTFDSLFPIVEKQLVRPVYPVGYVLYCLASHIKPMTVLIRIAKVTKMFLEFVFVEKLPCFSVVVLYDGQSRVVYDTGDVYHVAQVSEIVGVIQFYGQCPHRYIIALSTTSVFHPMAKTRGLFRRYVCW